MRDAKPFSWWVQLRLRNPSQYYSLTSQDDADRGIVAEEYIL